MKKVFAIGAAIAAALGAAAAAAAAVSRFHKNNGTTRGGKVHV